MKSFPRYKSYKDSGVEWIGEIPGHWEVKKVKYLFDFIERGSTPIYADEGLVTINQACLSNYKLDLTKIKYHIQKEKRINIRGWLLHNDLMIASTGEGVLGKSVIFDKKNLDAMADSHITIVRNSKKKMESIFLYYLLYTQYDMINACLSLGSTKQTELQRDEFEQLLIPVPSSEERLKIISYLDYNVLQIDKTISKKQRLIELLKEQKEIIINQAVTRGLSSTGSGKVKMKDSGVEWIGDIPEHWEVKRGKFVFKEIDERSKTGKEELLSVSHMTGVTPRSEKNVNMFLSEDYSGSKICQKDDLVINIMWAWMGALGVSSVKGIVSPSYGVFRQIKKNTFNSWYLEHLLRSKIYVTEYNRRSTGIHSSRLRLYSDVFLNMLIVIPSIEEQNKIELEVKSSTGHIDAVIFNYEREIDLINEYKTVLISNAVTGKIKVG